MVERCGRKHSVALDVRRVLVFAGDEIAPVDFGAGVPAMVQSLRA
jgi:hypothetical protein